MSRRSAAKLLSDPVGVPISLGAVSAVEARVSEAVARPVAVAWQRGEGAPIKHTDCTDWLKAGVVLALWTIVSTAATVFKIVADGSLAPLAPLYGALRGVLVSDRAAALAFWAMERRQICWAHLLRKYVSSCERAGPAGEIARQLLDYVDGAGARAGRGRTRARSRVRNRPARRRVRPYPRPSHRAVDLHRRRGRRADQQPC